MFGLAFSLVASLTVEPPEPALAVEPAAVVPTLVQPASSIDSRHIGPTELPPTDIRYEIFAELTPETRTIDGREHVSWRNPSTTTIDRVPLHLYLNAFRHAGSTWFSGSPALRGGDSTHHLDAHDDPWGYVEIASVHQGDQALVVEAIQPNDGNSFDRSLVEVRLAKPLRPGETLELEIEFRSRLPIPMARTGGFGHYFHIAQWFPKVGAWDPAGKRGVAQARWAARQFHGPTEFFADFARYEVTVDVPAGWTVVGTGESDPVAFDDTSRARTIFRQDAVHDFAWVASNAIHVETHPYTPGGGGNEIAISYVVPIGREHEVPRLRTIAETSFDVLGRRVGPYPYTTMTVVEPPFSAAESAGMEYPTLVTGLPSDPLFDWPQLAARLSETTVAHELTHNYFYGLVANDEQQEAFLDEGFTSYWEGEIVAAARGEKPDWARLFSLPLDGEDAAQRGLTSQLDTIREPMLRRPANMFYPGTHSTQIYSRTRATMATAANLFGQAAVDRLFATYFARWRFRHPTPADFFAVADEIGPPTMATFLREAYLQPQMPDYEVARAESHRFEPPLGHVPMPNETVLITRENRHDDAHREVGLDPIAKESGPMLTAIVQDPGYARAGDIVEGRVTRVPLEIRHQDARDDWEPEDDAYHESRVLLRGPGWRGLPVTVQFRFADGAVVEDDWDGQASWRSYRFVRNAPLDLVWIDPDKQIRLDADPDNNGRRVHPDLTHVDRWSAMLSRVIELVVLGGSLWL